MASSEVDQKFLGRLARDVEPNNSHLSQMLFKILGLSINLSGQLVKARKQRRLDSSKSTHSWELYFHIIWLSREGLVMLEQYVLPMVGDHVELKVLAHKLRASFYHIFVLFHNNPQVSPMGISTPEVNSAPTMGRSPEPHKLDKGKGVDRGGIDMTSGYANMSLEGGPVGPPPGFDLQDSEQLASFLLPSVDYLPTAHGYFKEAIAIADSLLWGSHSLRLSLKTEYAAFLYECVHDHEASRRVAKKTIAEVYEATEGMDDDMFSDACELVTVLGKMMKRGLGTQKTSRSTGPSPAPQATSESVATAVPPAGMENPI
ncbi:14-3-3 domain-containing protein [Microdochium trichocladiopsis]|uniref:14-3-3 domain-containing protein n=1 Tax=Microdochium trichocladiopsis TaxID=1682393 RepID=A0A9P8Y8U6_9PEZI|nr:14-3-3 domain-containing protein [Microdochium trichocladiopsis]KAH7033227.1 14-3-3 domain-containing protein [Microdochium trichocladiopsis]